MITLQQFADRIADGVKQMLGAGYEVTLPKMRKSNDTELIAISIRAEDSKISPVIYLEEFYKIYKNKNVPISILAQNIIAFYHKSKQESFDLTGIDNFDDYKDRICYTLIGASRNHITLSNMPHRTGFCGELTLIYYIWLDDRSIIRINNKLMDIWGVSENDLYEAAHENTPKIRKGQVISMSQLFNTKDVPMYIITNMDKSEGAVVMLYDSVLKNFSNLMRKTNFYIIPCSRHEVIVIPAIGCFDIDGMAEMIRDVNREELDPEDILSDQLYYYNSIEDKIALVEDMV